MKTTGIFTTHEYRIRFKHYGQDILLYPFGDIHWNSPACDKDKFISLGTIAIILRPMRTQTDGKTDCKWVNIEAKL